LYPLSATIAKVNNKNVYVTLGANMGLRPGMWFKTVSEGQPIVDPATGEQLGTETVETGIIKIESVEENLAKARILKNKRGIGVGDEVREMRATTRFGITAGYNAIGLVGVKRAVWDTIMYTRHGEEETESFEVEERFLPYEDVALRGLDNRAGVTVAF